ncbi:MAG: glycosyltransferase [Phycisphaerales bacterium]|nr:glycosyltransferase [Phycisphaerales bacterium]
MIFVTVGHQMPFDRMVKAVDDWAALNQRSDVFAQIGSTKYRPEHIQWAHTIDPNEFQERIAQADAVVAHAGTGTILTALEQQTPILVMPRRAALLETRNDHQVATAQRFLEMGRVAVAMDETELPAMLEKLSQLSASDTISSGASPELIQAISDFIHHEL